MFSVYENATYEYTVEAWTDVFGGWQHEFAAKFEAGIANLMSETLEGAALLAAAAKRTRGPDAKRLREFAEQMRTGENAEINRLAHAGELEVLMATYAARSGATQYTPPPRVTVDRVAARTAAWYEFFPRSAEGRADRGSTFRDCLGRVDDARAMGFDVIYFPPIHPIGLTNRKGPQQLRHLRAGRAGRPLRDRQSQPRLPNGGGHKDVEPSLGTLEDFAWLNKQIRRRGMEIALDFAINCSPDHPYVAEHPEWFYKRPDGTIKYAENPPKKYEDIYPLNFRCPNWQELWEEMKSIILFWAERGVRIFRVDNPHTKPVAFWEYLIAGVREKFPDTIFLSEAFTRPKMMKVLAKAGFTQSYTYFTWRTTKQELTEYFTELTQTEMRRIFPRQSFHQHAGYFAVPSPDGRASDVPDPRRARGHALQRLRHLQRLRALRKRRSPRPRRIFRFGEISVQRARLGRARNIKELITSLNRIRRENRALHFYDNLRFHPAATTTRFFSIAR